MYSSDILTKIMKTVERQCMPFFLVLWYQCLVRRRLSQERKGDFSLVAVAAEEVGPKEEEKPPVRFAPMTRTLAVFLWPLPLIFFLIREADTRDPLPLRSQPL